MPGEQGVAAEDSMVVYQPSRAKSWLAKAQDRLGPVLFPNDNSKWFARRNSTPETFLAKFKEDHRELMKHVVITEHWVRFTNSRDNPCRLHMVQIEPKDKRAFDDDVSQNSVLHVLGRGDFLARRMEENIALVRKGLTVFCFDFPGINASTGGEIKCMSDINNSTKTVIHYLIGTLGIQRKDLIIFGNCMGASNAAHAIMGEPGLRLVYSNGVDTFIGVIEDIVNDMQLGLLRLMQYVVPFDYSNLMHLLLRYVDMDVWPNELLGVPGPQLLVLQREWGGDEPGDQGDGVILKASLANHVRRLLKRIQEGEDYLDTCPEGFRRIRDELWSRSVLSAKDTGRYNLKGLRENRHKKYWYQKLLPNPGEKWNVLSLLHYARLTELVVQHAKVKQAEVVCTDTSAVSQIVSFASKSKRFLHANPEQQNRVLVPYREPKPVSLSLRNMVVTVSPLLTWAAFHILPGLIANAMTGGDATMEPFSEPTCPANATMGMWM